MSTQIENFLQQFKDEEVLYFPNPGNAGDSVIATATYQLFERIGLNYTTPRIGRCDLRNRVVIYGGGGNLVRVGSHSEKFASYAHSHAKRLVILPHTVKAVTQLLESFGPNVDVICRESISYEYVRSTSPRANVHLMDDMAFGLDIGDAIAGKPILRRYKRMISCCIGKAFLRANVPSISNVLRASQIPKIKSSLRNRESSTELFCFRTDGEKTAIPIPATNVDLSEVFQFGVETSDAAYLSTRELLLFLSKFKTVHTNRLHIAISSALLGLDVMFYSNDYFKCRAVYEKSMKDKFNNVRWMG